MPPEDKGTTPAPTNFDFIMKDPPKSKRKFGLPKMRGLVLVIAIGALLTIAIVAYGLISGRSDNATNLYNLINESSEITTISTEVAAQATDSDTRNLAATVAVSLASQQKQFKDYMTKKGSKLEPKQLVPVKTDIEDRLKAAIPSNTYDQTYLSYLKTSVDSYSQSLSEIHNSASDELKSILSEAYLSISAILESPKVKS